MNTMMYVYLPTSDTALDVEVEFTQPEPAYAELQRIAKAYGIEGHLERVRVLFDPTANQHATNGLPVDMLVDEEGVLKSLPVNAAATRIYQAASLKRNPRLSEEEIAELPRIYGVALVFDRQVWF